MAPKYNTWAITIRPTNGITNEQIECVTNWIVKTCDYYHIVTEKDGWERHLHAALFLKRDDHKSNLNNRILSIPCLKDTLTGAEQVVVRKGTKIMYDWNWINKYMNLGPELASTVGKIRIVLGRLLICTSVRVTPPRVNPFGRTTERCRILTALANHRWKKRHR